MADEGIKATDAISALERFFLDIIGQLIPGTAFLLGLSCLWNGPLDWIEKSPVLSSAGLREIKWLLLGSLAYAVGHGITSFGEMLLVPSINRIVKFLQKIKLGWLVPPTIVSNEAIFDKLKADPIFIAFTTQAKKVLPFGFAGRVDSMSVPSWRSIAMSFAGDQRHTVYRFMFISLFNLGIATALVSLAMLCPILKAMGVLEIPSWKWWGLLILLSLPFFERRFAFYKMAMQVPFSMALVGLQGKEEKREPLVAKSTLSMERTKPQIYLAGGFMSGWQDLVTGAVPGMDYLDPRTHGLKKADEYTAWDLEALRRCDCIFAYLEVTNPGGYALALEVGYGKALGKFVIFVCEKAPADGVRYLDMVIHTSDVSFDHLEKGIDYLQKYQTLT